MPPPASALTSVQMPPLANYRELAGIYSIRCVVNGRTYVGSSIDIEHRWEQHKSYLNCGKHHSKHLQHAWNKYGADQFEWTILELIQIDKTDLVEAKLLILSREQYFIDSMNAYQNGFNSCPVAESTLGMKQSLETRAKISASNRRRRGRPGHPQTIDTKIKIANANIGKKLLETTKAKDRAVNAGKKLSEETKAKLCKHGARSDGRRADGYAIWMRIRKNRDKIASRWSEFMKFWEDVGPRPSTLHYLFRWPDESGNYEPGNVKWMTNKQIWQCRKREAIAHTTT